MKKEKGENNWTGKLHYLWRRKKMEKGNIFLRKRSKMENEKKGNILRRKIFFFRGEGERRRKIFGEGKCYHSAKPN